jgi:hypothetical protein
LFILEAVPRQLSNIKKLLIPRTNKQFILKKNGTNERRECIYSKYLAQLLESSFSKSITINFHGETIPVVCSCFYIHYWNNKEEIRIDHKYTYCSLNNSQWRKNQSIHKELLKLESIQSIENKWLRRQKSKKKRKAFEFSLKHQITGEERKSILTKKNM